jgi:hypothetical protein
MQTEPQSVGIVLDCATKQLLLLHWRLFEISDLTQLQQWTEHPGKWGYFTSTYKFCPKTIFFFLEPGKRSR